MARTVTSSKIDTIIVVLHPIEVSTDNILGLEKDKTIRQKIKLITRR